MYYVGGIQCVASDELIHFGVKGMRWGVRRYQNPDGSLTAAGRKKYLPKEYKSMASGVKKYLNPDGTFTEEGRKKFNAQHVKDLDSDYLYSNRYKTKWHSSQGISKMSREDRQKEFDLIMKNHERGRAKEKAKLAAAGVFSVGLMAGAAKQIAKYGGSPLEVALTSGTAIAIGASVAKNVLRRDKANEMFNRKIYERRYKLGDNDIPYSDNDIKKLFGN